MPTPKLALNAALFSLASFSFITPASAGVVFSESFEAPVVSGYSNNSIPSGGKWIGATAGFGATNRGLYNETVIWPATPAFSTHLGAQAYYLNYTNSGLTTAVGATGQTLTAGVTYKVSFNAGVTAGTASGSYLVELVAFAATDTNTARENCQGTRPGAILATASGTVTTNTMSGSGQLTYTPAAGNANLGKDLGIRLIKSTNNVLYDNIRLITGHDMNPTPASGETIAGGNVSLNWTNMPPTSGTDVTVDVWFGTNAAALTKVVTGGLNTTTTNVSAPSANTYYWRVDTYPDGNSAGTPVTGDLFTFIVVDTDNDGFPDTYELANTTPASNTALNTGDDLDADGLTNLQEYQYNTLPNDNDNDNDTLLDGPEITGLAPRPATNPRLADTDGDGLSDGVENNSGIWVGTSNTGTNPADADWDNDGLKDGVETKTGTFVSRTTNTGTDPYLADTDSDGAGDWYEVAATYTNPNSAAETSPIPYPLPDPVSTDLGNPAKPVKVYIMSGQSNMVGIGYVNGGAGSLDTITKQENKFPNFVNASNAYTKRNDVIYKGVVTATAQGPLTAGQGADSSRVGVELGFGHVMGWHHDEPVLLLKASEGNRSLGWDFAPPDTTRFDLAGKTYAAYGESPLNWTTGSTPVPISWYAGLQYDMCFKNEADWAPAGASQPAIINAYDVLKNGVLQNLPTTDNNLNGRTYEIAGFVWWQGHKDQYDAGHYTRYEQNLARLIPALRTQFNAPNAPFVVATIGFDGGNYALNSPYDYIYKAQKAISDPAKHPAFAGNVKSVDTLGYWRSLAESPGTQGFHYNNSAETYTLVGDALGRAMLDLLDDTDPPAPNPPTFATAPTPVNTTTVGMVATSATDVSGPVEYYFENITNSNNSGWSTSTTWQNTGLTNAVSYDFRFKARDSKNNETNWSATATAAPGLDITAPLPNPMTFAAPPTALGEVSITMTAAAATDINGVQYEFVCTIGGGPNSGLQNGTTFVATGLTPGSTYTYIVRARDSIGNATADSAAASATTTAPDTAAPTPSPLTFATPPTAQGQTSITMTATTAADPSGVEYYFDCLTLDGHDSGWQNSPAYTDSGLTPNTEYTYQVQVRDKSPAQNLGVMSSQGSATTEAPDTTPPVILTLSPADNATAVSATSNLVATFDEVINPNTGTITLKNLSDATQTVINITDSTQVIISGSVLTINPSANFLSGKNYAVQISPAAFEDDAGNPHAGIADDIAWNFTTATPPIGPGGALIYEPFADSNSSLTGNSVGTGLSGTWSGSGSVAAGSLSFGSLPAGSGNKSSFNNHNGLVAVGNTLTNAGLLADGAVLWFSFLVTTGGDIGTNGDLGFVLGTDTINSGNNLAISNSGQAMGVRFKNNQLRAAHWAPAIAQSGGSTVAASTTYLVAGKFTWGSATDKLEVYNVSSNLTLGSAVSTYTSTVNVNQSLFDTISIGSKSATPSHFFDEIRFGATFADVTGQGGAGPGPVASFAISPISSPQTVGSPINGITITAKDSANATATSFTGTVNFGGTGGFTGTSASFTAGVLSGVSLTPTIAGDNLTLTVNDGASHIGTATLTTIQTQYAAWSGSAPFDDDPNNDGVDNGMAWLLGAANKDANALGKLPAASQTGGSLTLTFTCLNAASRGNTTLQIQHSSNVGQGDPWVSVLVPETTSTVDGVTFTVTPNDTSNQIVATIPIAEAQAGKLFARLRAVANP